MFENVINEEAIDNLDEETLDKLLEMLTKAGYQNDTRLRETRTQPQ